MLAFKHFCDVTLACKDDQTEGPSYYFSGRVPWLLGYWGRGQPYPQHCEWCHHRLPEAPLHPTPLPAGPPQHPRPGPRRHRGQAQKERDRLRAARQQAALAAAPPPSLTPTLAAAPVAPSSPEALRNTEKPNLDILNMSNTSETRMEEEAPSTPDHIDHEELPAIRHIFKWNEDDIDGSITEATRIHNEIGGTGRCHFCDFTCDPNPCKLQPWYSHVMNDHLEANHPEAWEWFA